MKILFLSISYHSSQENIYTDLVDELIDKGHELIILSSNSSEKITTKNKKIIGFFNDKMFNSNLIKKGLTTLFIGHSFKNVIRKELKNEKIDLILYATPPVTLYPAIKYSKKRFKAKSYLMLKDIFPQNAVDLGMMKKWNPIYLFFRFQEKKLYKTSDFIGCMSEGNKSYILQHNHFLNERKTGVFYNSIKIDKRPIFNVSDKKDTTFIFGGNLGRPQNIRGLLKIIEELKNYDLAKFILIGKGTEVSYVREFIQSKEMKNLKYFEFLSREDYEAVLKDSDVGIISLDSHFTIPNIPSKFQSYLKLGKPVLAITDQNTDLKDMIKDNQCGWWCDAEDGEKIIQVIKYICEHKQEHIEKGKNGYKYLLREFNVKDSVNKLEKFMEVNR